MRCKTTTTNFTSGWLQLGTSVLWRKSLKLTLPKTVKSFIRVLASCDFSGIVSVPSDGFGSTWVTIDVTEVSDAPGLDKNHVVSVDVFANV